MLLWSRVPIMARHRPVQSCLSERTRLDKGGTDATRIIVDSSLSIPLNSKVLTVDSPKKAIIATTEKADKDKLKLLNNNENVRVITVPLKESRVGTSLTVVDTTENSFRVSLIPVTKEETVLLKKKTGDEVNLECDTVGKYCRRQVP